MRDREAKRMGCSRYTCKKKKKKSQMIEHSSCCVEAKTIHLEGGMEVERLACVSEHFRSKTFTFPNICLCYIFDKTHNERDTIKSTKVLHCNS